MAPTAQNEKSPRALSTSLSQEENVDIILANSLFLETQRQPAWIPRIKHRLAITAAWNIPRARARARTTHITIADIGCGQGESAVTLAHVLGPSATIHGIDNALPDYGTPYTVAQSWAHIATKTALGRRIRFHRADAAAFFNNAPESGGGGGAGQPEEQGQQVIVDAATLCHSLWYFPDRASIFALFRTLAAAGRVPTVYLAEYAFEASSWEQEPHLLAAKSQALFHSCKAPRPAGRFTLNIRAAPDVGVLVEACQAAGYGVARQGRITPGEDLLEGHRQAMYTRSEAYVERVKAEGFAKEQEDEILAYIPLIERAFEKLRAAGKETARAMDVWWAELHLGA